MTEPTARQLRTEEVFARLFGPRDTSAPDRDPEFGEILRRLIFGDVFATGVLDDRTRELVTVTCLGALQALPQLQAHLGAALKVGVTPSTALAKPTVTLMTTPLTGELASSHYSSLEPGGSVPHRSGTALALYLEGLKVPTVDLTTPSLETLSHDTAPLYRLDGNTYAQVGERWFRVVENDNEQVQIVDPQTPSKTGPLLIHNTQGQWFVDTRLRLRGGAGGTSLQSQLKAQRKAKEQQKKRLGVALETFKGQEAANNAELKKAYTEMLGATGLANEQATQRYLAHLEKLIDEYEKK